MPIFIYRIDHIGRSRVAFATCAISMCRLAAVPAVVNTLLADINLLPGILADIIDIKLARAWPERKTERIAQAPRKGFLALLCGGAPSHVAAGAAGANERVIGWNTAIRRDPQNLTQQDELIACCIVVARGAAITGVIRTAIAHA